ncbi:MAG: hypothetical protein KIT87_06690 [Anaerolineae bacterium]|nr:hypothetical protein [Anaerolineae bacterium]
MLKLKTTLFAALFALALALSSMHATYAAPIKQPDGSGSWNHVPAAGTDQQVWSG